MIVLLLLNCTFSLHINVYGDKSQEENSTKKESVNSHDEWEQEIDEEGSIAQSWL